MDIYLDDPYITLSRLCDPYDIITLGEPREVPTLKNLCMLYYQEHIRTKATLMTLGLPQTLQQEILDILPFQYDVSS